MNIPFELKRSNKKVTARSGLAIFSEFIQQFEISELVDNHLPKPLSNRGFAASDYVSSLLFNLYGGGESISDTKEIRDDFAIRELIDLKTVPSESAIGDWLCRTGKHGGAASFEVVNDEVIRLILEKSKLKEVSLTFDPTLIKSEKQDAKMTYEGYRGYRPVFAFIDELKLIVCFKFKEGNDNSGSFDIIKKTVEKVERWGFKVKHVSADSEYYNTNILDYLIRKEIAFTIAMRKDSAVMDVVKTISENAWAKFKTHDAISPDREIAETVHTTNHGCSAFRMMVLRWKNKDAERCYHCIATNIVELSASQIVWKYNRRADQENCIKEIKYGFGMKKMPCGTFEANAMFSGIAVLVYNLFIAQKLLTMPKNYHSKTIKTIRWLLVNTAGLVVKTASRVKMTLFATKEKYNVFLEMRRRTHALNTR